MMADAKKPARFGWSPGPSVAKFGDNYNVQCWRRKVDSGELAVVSGLDLSCGPRNPAWRITVTLINNSGVPQSPEDGLVRDVLEDFDMLDAREQGDEPIPDVVPGRGFYKFVNGEATA